MKKILFFLLIVILSPLIAGAYGILHDQITYSISLEYYTKFKFIQFGIEEYFWDRLGASIVGFMSTWWFGLILGIVIGAVGFIQKNAKQMFKVSLQAIFINIVVALFVGLMGLIYGYSRWGNVSREHLPNWNIPDSVIDFNSFVMVGSMHNFSYIGGILGLVLAIIWQVRSKKRIKNNPLS
ncbi:hypothetical protein [Bernardetia sp.]|uniref:hypothetical protein n=1 Tax=Bernardetia sp. TaxID=1937974 RepID=UPI0025B92DF6|nr:hypothetical protein [Bernardetia sp.]